MAADSNDVLKYLAARGVPEKFVWPEVPDGGLKQETVELVGTLQAGNAEEIFIFTGGVVLKLPTDAVLGISDSSVGPVGSSRMLVSTTAVAETNNRLLLLPEVRDGVAPLVLENPDGYVEHASYTDKTLERFKDIMEKLKQMGLPVPVGSNAATETASYMSSATGGTGDKSDSDPIRMTDD
ncbi:MULTISPECIES: hypothetical protein [Catellatospora]|uniref:Uncharacterized protein n=2 Tax=Catellatospora TaxID=53365 RepID=A0A8J3NXM1_9ACTN|nr:MULTISPECIES: hypothetical protein [Catellatospora]RKE11133.1 hypothetical protein C8E86_6056 [Catellatospora citrea]GIF90269.1 hypothetical protein Cch02nite_37130 [Catellatospora chokoriensis]GIF96595.1 hypothetical protein Cci01nite_16890 [Catellatospora citrea]